MNPFDFTQGSSCTSILRQAQGRPERSQGTTGSAWFSLDSARDGSPFDFAQGHTERLKGVEV